MQNCGCTLQGSPLKEGTAEQLLEASKLLTWEQLFPVMEGMTRITVRCDEEFHLDLTVSACKALQLLCEFTLPMLLRPA